MRAEHEAPRSTCVAIECGVPTTPALRTTLHVAAVVLAATTGALLGFGTRLGAPTALLSAAGDRLRGVPPFVSPDHGFRFSATLGALQHVALMLAWSAAFALAARRLRGRTLAVVAAAGSALIVAVDALVPAPLRFAAGAMTLAQRVVYGIVLAAALGTGVRVARSERVDL